MILKLKKIYKKEQFNPSFMGIFINLFLTLIFIAPFNIVGVLLSKLLPKNDNLYLDNIILAKKVKDV